MGSAVLAADAVAGEKERKTLESLLHSSIRDRDLFLAKFLSAFLPALAVSWLGFLRSEEHTSELQSLMRISYAVFCLKKKTITHHVRVVITITKETKL